MKDPWWILQSITGFSKLLKLFNESSLILQTIHRTFHLTTGKFHQVFFSLFEAPSVNHEQGEERVIFSLKNFSFHWQS